MLQDLPAPASQRPRNSDSGFNSATSLAPPRRMWPAIVTLLVGINVLLVGMLAFVLIFKIIPAASLSQLGVQASIGALILMLNQVVTAILVAVALHKRYS